jgi:multidrug resistance efflux pump
MASWFRIVKRVVAGAAVLGSLGFYMDGRLRLVASYAVVAAPATIVRAPADGAVTHSVGSFSVVPAGAVVARVRPALENDPELRAAKAELETVRAEVASLKQLASFTEEMRSNVASRKASLGARRTDQLEQLLTTANAALEAKKAAKDEAKLAGERAVALCAEGLMGAQECAAAGTRAEVSLREFESAESQARLARQLLEASRSGVDVGQDIGSELTYARQHRDELTFRLAGLKQNLSTQEARVRALEMRVNPPELDVSVAARSRTWSVYVQDGERVVKNTPLFQVVDCDHAFVFAIVSEDRFERLRVGMKAEVEIDGKKHAGHVAQLLGPYGTFAQDQSMQPQPPVIVNARDAAQASVAVAVPGLSASMGAACGIGMRAEVSFTE